RQGGGRAGDEVGRAVAGRALEGRRLSPAPAPVGPAVRAAPPNAATGSRGGTGCAAVRVRRTGTSPPWRRSAPRTARNGSRTPGRARPVAAPGPAPRRRP